jgi:hypothetical protein
MMYRFLRHRITMGVWEWEVDADAVAAMASDLREVPYSTFGRTQSHFGCYLPLVPCPEECVEVGAMFAIALSQLWTRKPSSKHHMDLSLQSAGRGSHNNKLVWRGFYSYNKPTDDLGEFHLKRQALFL